MKRSVFLSTFLLAAVLSPIVLYGYTCVPPQEARLSVLQLRVGDFHGENVIKGFDPEVFSYDARFPEDESEAVLWVRTKHPSMRIEVQYDGVPVQLIGQSVAKLDVPLGRSEFIIDVATRQPPSDSSTYVVHIERVSVFACTEQGIRDAIAYGGGPNYFDCDGPTVVPTVDEIVIHTDVILDAEGHMIVDAGGGGGGTGGAGGDGAGGAGFMAAEVAPKANGPHRVFSIPEGVTAELIGLTVTGGSTPEAGGGILNAGTLSLTNSTVTGNHADIAGGARNLETGTLIVTDCNISQNTATRFAGGLHNWGQMDVVDSVISNNRTGLSSAGISNWPEVAVMTLTRTTVTGNTTGGSGGGISNTGTAKLDETTVSLNTAGADGGGILNNDGTLIIIRSTISENTGGGCAIENYSGSIEIDSTTISGNTGGAIENPFPDGTLALINTTVSGNSRPGRGAIENAGSAVVIASTLSLNVADGTVLWDGSCLLDPTCPPGALTIRNTIIDGGCMGTTAVHSLGGNIESEGDTCGLSHPTDQFNVSAEALILSRYLRNNGGPTETDALGWGSVAIDAIAAAECVDADGAPLMTDQTGAPRPEMDGTMCDVGAFEFSRCGVGEPDPWQPGEERLSVGLFYECGRSETIYIDNETTYYWVFVTDQNNPTETLTFRQGTSEDRLEGRISEEITLLDKPWWGGGFIWFEPIDLSAWTTMFVAFKSSDPSFATFELALDSGEGETPARFTLDPRDYGYANDGEWHVLEIPLQDAIDLGWDPSVARSPFIIFSAGGEPGDVLLIDNLYFTKDGNGGTGGTGGTGIREVCQTCVADSECGDEGVPSDAFRCVPMFYPDAQTRFPDDATGFCLEIFAPGGCEQPYAITISNRPSLSDPTLRSYCGINEALATCSAVWALEFDETCPSGDECPVGGLCREVGGLPNRCTYLCSSLMECLPGSTCGSSDSGGDDYCGG